MPVDVAFSVGVRTGEYASPSIHARIGVQTGRRTALSLRASIGTRTGFIAGQLLITTLSLPGGQANTPYGTQTVTARGGSATDYTWSVAFGALPPGLALAATGTPSTTISGTPTTPGVYNFTIRVRDSVGYADDQAYTVTIGPYPIILPNPASDTIRGGNVISLATPLLVLDSTFDTQLTERALPAGWSSASSAGGRVVASVRGVELRSTTQGVASLNGPTPFGSGEITLEVAFLAPGDLRANVGALVVRLALQNNTGRVEANLGATPGAALPHPLSLGTWTRIHLIRGANRVWAATSDPQKDYDRVRTAPFLGPQRAPLLDAPDPGTVQAAVQIEASLGAVVLVRRFQVRSAGAIDGRLLLEARAEVPYRIVGRAPPAASAERLGVRAMSVFGLFGEVTDPERFAYTLPVPRTLTHVASGDVEAYADPALRNEGPRQPTAAEADPADPHDPTGTSGGAGGAA